MFLAVRLCLTLHASLALERLRSAQAAAAAGPGAMSALYGAAARLIKVCVLRADSLDCCVSMLYFDRQREAAYRAGWSGCLLPADPLDSADCGAE